MKITSTYTFNKLKGTERRNNVKRRAHERLVFACVSSKMIFGVSCERAKASAKKTFGFEKSSDASQSTASKPHKKSQREILERLLLEGFWIHPEDASSLLESTMYQKAQMVSNERAQKYLVSRVFLITRPKK